MGPFLKSKNKTSKIMYHLLIALFPILLFSIYKNGYIPYLHNKISFIKIFYPLFLVLIGAFTSFFIELIYMLVIKKDNLKYSLKNSYSFFPGMFLAFVLPLNIPIYVLIIGAIVASGSKIIFGGFGKNIFNPALIGYVFVVAAYAGVFSTNAYLNSYELDTISKATPLTNVSLVSGIGSYKELVTPYGSLIDFFVGTIPGSLGETSALLCVITFLYLAFTKSIKWKIPFTYITTVFILTLGIGRIFNQGIYYPLFNIFSGGLMFGAVFMATDPVTSTTTSVGQILQGIFLGIMTVILRFIGVEGVATSILLMNMFVFIFDRVGAKTRFNFFKSVIWFVAIGLIIIILILSLAATKKTNGSSDPNFQIISKDKNNNEVVYVVTQKGYGGSIKAEVIVKNDKVIKVEILSNHETKDKYQLVIKEDYLTQLINNQDNIDSLDTVSGATITSTALKKMIINVMEDYK